MEEYLAHVQPDELTDRGLLLHVVRHLQRLEEIIMATQQELEAAVAQLSGVLDSIAAGISTVQTETTELGQAFNDITAEIARLNDLVAAGQQIDLTSLNDLVGRAQGLSDQVATTTAGLTDAANQVEGIVPPPGS